jgi:hypothetical protein
MTSHRHLTHGGMFMLFIYVFYLFIALAVETYKLQSGSWNHHIITGSASGRLKTNSECAFITFQEIIQVDSYQINIA